MFKVIKIDENNVLDPGVFKFETLEEAEKERIRIIEEEGLSFSSVTVESDEEYIKSNDWVDKLS